MRKITTPWHRREKLITIYGKTSSYGKWKYEAAFRGQPEDRKDHLRPLLAILKSLLDEFDGQLGGIEIRNNFEFTFRNKNEMQKAAPKGGAE